MLPNNWLCRFLSAIKILQTALPVRLHQFGNPFGLVKLAARQKFAHYGLDVDNWRSVDRVQAFDMKLSALNGQHSAN